MGNIIFIEDDKRFIFTKKILAKNGYICNNELLYDDVVLPFKGVDKELIDEGFFILNRNANFYFYNNTDYLKYLKDKYQLKLFNLCDDQEFNDVNNRATAEGVIANIISLTNQNINNLNIAILGYGFSGKKIDELLNNLSNSPSIFIRNQQIIDELSKENKKIYHLNSLGKLIEYGVIINTIPYNIIDDEILRLLSPETLILDISSRPYGMNHECAKTLGLKSYILPALPAIYSSKDSGEALAYAIMRLKKNA